MNPYPSDTAEWLAHEALRQFPNNTAFAVQQLRLAIDVLLLWQRAAMFDARDCPEEPRRG